MIRKWLKFWVLVLLSVDISAKEENFYKNYRIEGINKRSYQDADSTEHPEHSGFTTEQEEGILELINSVRGRDRYNQVSNLMRMEWNENLASIAKKWSDQCKMEFGPSSCKKKFSQNRGIISNYLLDQFRQINDWADGSNYTYKTNTCNGICDSYKVLMWAESYAVGCSKSKCKNFKQGYFMICNFYPPIPDLGLQPYKVGKACADCPSDSTCEEGFCVKMDKSIPKEIFACKESIDDDEGNDSKDDMNGKNATTGSGNRPIAHIASLLLLGLLFPLLL